VTRAGSVSATGERVFAVVGQQVSRVGRPSTPC
jgi:hypothetical protein